jgi:hypothetical protein
MRFINYQLNPAIAIALCLTASIGFVGANLFPTPIQFWVILLFLSLIISITGMLYWHPAQHEEANPSKKSKSWWIQALELLSALLPLLVFTPAVIAFIQLPDAHISHHGDLHANYIIQILHGVGVPDNGFFPEAPINYYWLYHAIIAAISYALNIPIPVAHTVLSSIVLFATLGWASLCLEHILPHDFHPALRTMMALLLVFGFNTLGIVYSLGDYADSDLIVNLAPSAPITASVISDLVDKFLNFTAFSLQIMYLWMGLYAVLRLLKEPPSIYPVILLLVSIISGLAFQLSGGLFIGLTLIPAAIASDIICVFLQEKRFDFRALREHYAVKIEHIRSTWGWQSWALLAVACLLLIPIVIYVIEFMQHFPSLGKIHFKNLYGIVGIFSTTFAMLPFLFLATVLGIIRANRLMITLVLATAISWAMYYLLEISNGNQYKFLLLSTTYFTLPSVWAMFQIRVSLHENQKFLSLGLPLVLIMSALVLINIDLSGIAFYERYRETQYEFLGSKTAMPEHPYQDIFTWISDNTDPNTILVMDIRQTRYAALLSQRRAYVVERQFALVEGVPDYEKRLWVAMSFVLPNRTLADREEALAYIAAFVERHPLLFVVADEANISETELDTLGMILIHDGEIASVYQLKD